MPIGIRLDGCIPCFGRLHKMMIRQLISCGCRVYLPHEIVVEVFNHAEAAKARYSFVASIMDNDEDWVRNELKNIFIEDYYVTRKITKGKHVSWETYIGNYYSNHYGINLIYVQIKEKLGDKIIYGEMPANCQIDTLVFTQLSEATLEGKNIVRLQYDLQAEIQDMFAVKDEDEYIDIYNKVVQKGYSFIPYVNNIVEESKEKNSKIEELEKRLKEKEEQLEKAQKRIALEKYEIRSGKKRMKGINLKR